MKAVVFERKEARYAATALTTRLTETAAPRLAPLRLADLDPPSLPGAGWHTVRPRLSGICGSDLALLKGRTSRYFEALASMPFVLGHEVVGDLDDGRRVVIDAVLGHAARGEPPPHAGAAPADGNDYGHLTAGPLGAGLQTGSCKRTGGGWSTEFVAHDSQLHEVPEDLSDEAAVMVEPAASAIHAALRAEVAEGDTVVVIGGGPIGLCAIAALRLGSAAERIIAAVKYDEQQQLATRLGADLVVKPNEIRRAVRRVVGCRMTGDLLSGGADITVDAVGSPGSLADAVAVTRPRGSVVLCGMPGPGRIDLAPVWHREVALLGAYTYGTEHLADGTSAHTFDMAFELVRSERLEELVSATYRLEDYAAALRHADQAGRRGSIKIAFDLRDERR
ncbi:MAG: zinc-binding dehydrogenase [bacterium]|nr:zinc-binding dehydrogenase [bacterium]MXV89687.1 zinc-binding dehydrogenase [Acidimicrobiia bacterium]MYC44254.1 zinc-binding dehydrogenase [Acidimicrobiia bacterium]MYI19557.1 zinc-binding dehydrogenase [Acidimicrobiia bacterium]